MDIQLLFITIFMFGCVKTSFSQVYQDISEASDETPVVLTCTGAAGPPYSWTLNGNPLTTSATDGFNITSYKDVGTYVCSNSTGQEQVKIIAVNPPEPEIVHEGKSIIFYDGDVDQKLICQVIADDPALTPTLNWEANSVVLGDQTINIASEAEGTKTTTTSELVLTKVEASTRGDFACTVTYTVEGQDDFQCTKTTTVLVRVHSSMEALWPALGIVAEILFIIVVIYIDHARKRKDKGEEKDE